MKRSRLLLALFCAMLALACGVPGQRLVVTPYLRTDGASIGQGRLVNLKVEDNRVEQVVGYRDGPKRASPITIEGSLSEAVMTATLKAFAEHGFGTVTGRERMPVNLTVEIVELSFRADPGTVTNKIYVRAKARVRATNKGASFAREHLVENEKELFFTPSEFDNAELISNTLSEALGALIEDKALLQFLAKE